MSLVYREKEGGRVDAAATGNLIIYVLQRAMGSAGEKKTLSLYVCDLSFTYLSGMWVVCVQMFIVFDVDLW